MLLHKHGINWRDRHPDHPNDPGWERGTYSECHKQVRRAINEGEWLLDAVHLGRGSRSFVAVRSMFLVSSKVGDILQFDRYWFARDDYPPRVSRDDLRRIRPDILQRSIANQTTQMMGPLRAGVELHGPRFDRFVRELRRSMILRRPVFRSRSTRNRGCKGCSSSSGLRRR